MEPASFAIGIAGLAALFETCLRGFELFEQGKDFGRSYTILLTRLDAQKLLFLIWGEAVGLTVGNGSQSRILIEDSKIARLIQRHLECIRLIFEDADQLSRKYGVTRMRSRRFPDSMFGNPSSPSKSQLPLRRYVHWVQKQSLFRLRAKWAIHDQTKFKTMLDDLSNLLQQLRDITSAIADIERQRNLFVEKIDNCDEIEDLEIIEEALSVEDPALSSAASERRMALTEAAMTIRDDEFQQHEDDDLVTHADSDPAAQASLDPNELPGMTGEVLDYQSEEPFSIVEAYGHQNNLSEIQRKNQVQFSTAQDGATSLRLDTGNLSPHAVKYLKKELKRFQAEAMKTPFISLGLQADCLDRLLGTIQGPPNTPYEGGIFSIAMRIPQDFPFKPVHCRLLTPIHHPNINSDGRICVDLLDNAWSPVWKLEHVLTAICSLLGSPQYEDAIVPHVAQQWKFDRYAFEVQARLQTQRFAMTVPATQYDRYGGIPTAKSQESAEIIPHASAESTPQASTEIISKGFWRRIWHIIWIAILGVVVGLILVFSKGTVIKLPEIFYKRDEYACPVNDQNQ